MSGRRHNSAFLIGSAGFTIIELLVVMVLSSLVVIGTASMFQSNRIAYSISDQVKSMEENVRVSMDVMAFSLRQASVNSEPPLWIMDNDAANNSNGVNDVIADFKAAVVTAGGAVKEGTDMIEVVTSLCPDPMYVSYNEKSAAMPRLPTPAVSACLDCDMSALSVPQIVDQCLDGIEAVIHHASDPTNEYSCIQTPTSTSSGGGSTVTITNNRGNDSGNDPGDCDNPETTSNTWTAKIDFGYHYIFYVYDDPLEPDNPKLMRYRVNGTLPGEVLANYVYDLQIMGGRDTTDDDVTDIDTWEDGAFDSATGSNDSNNVKAIRLSVLARTKDEDQRTKGHAAVTLLENSTIADPADKRRERVLVRSIRIRNKTF